MQSSITFKNIDPSKHFKSYVQNKLDRFDKLLDNPAETKVVLSVEKLRHIAEINLTGDKLNINAKEANNDMHAAIDLVLDKIEKQIKKSKEKTKQRRSGFKKSKTNNLMAEGTAFQEEEFLKQVKVRNIEYKPMGVEEAVMQMDIVNNTFLVFTNAETDRVNVLYRRNDGHLGLIQPTT
ncbi:MAG: ribosome-associated translation inhibitor RaiA [Deltaproteobacteria bacterium]|nr:ribosome-associated translation inhibitor RaiA [Deltaproteobacteria bacterium]MBW2010526.1 ribosome-associated translation inhibitor RaiA [Deltaproteobacteria bacterium]MBW2100213.1 ribosome-associated translation inhibitor RaiA [Deltaproteobacteria bacterium]